MEPCLSDMVSPLRRRLQTLEPLQWSHVFSDMVSARRDEVWIGIKLMEPCLSDMVRLRLNESYSGFNGAMSFQTW